MLKGGGRMKEKKVSIIMGIYNCEKTIEKAINSIINQDYLNWELIMCDDASRDNTYSIAQKYSEMYPKKIILLKNEKNLKLAATLNKCLSKATGEYIARMDSDDLVISDRFSKQVKFLEENLDYSVVGGAAILYDENGEKGVRTPKEIPQKEDLIFNVPHMHPTIMMRKEIYNILEGYRVCEFTERGQDEDMWFRFYSKGFKGYNLQVPVIKYHEGLADYKKRSIKQAKFAVKRKYYGYKLLGVSKGKFIYILKPLIAAMIPDKFMYLYHKRKGQG